MTERRHDREFVRTFFTSPTAVEGEDDSAKMLRSAAQLRGMQAPDVWVPDNEDATAPSMRDEGAENIIEVVSEHGADFPGEIHPRIVWHRDSPTTRYQGFQHMLEIADPERGAIEHIDGFVVPEVGDIDDWKKADEFFTIVENEHGLEAGSIAMSVIIESGQAELAMGTLREEMGKPTNNLERLFLLVDGEVDYTKDMRAITPTGELPPWPELRHNTSRGASAAGLIAVDGPYDDIRDVEGYHERMTENQAKGMLGIWSLTPGQVVEANTSPLPPKTGSWLLDIDGQQIELESEDGVEVYDGDRLSLEATGDGYELRIGGDTRELDEDELREELLDITSYVPSMDDIVDSMEEFEAAKEAGRGAIAMEQSATLRIGGTELSISKDRMWDEATYQAAMTPISLFQDVYENRPDQHEELNERYGASVVSRAMEVGL
ncbi:malate synthase [Haloferax mediterranei ATCC 33500]|uniref:Malate synthase n=1 Tax=Haloferax mediterranei (strain ATCC 33500 / DSM 1411 / JCM 8866 / NBRC 14739 / NCIMB 2177 / R-4) TaxID=523841 RepID=I3R6B0_HALMT|nr:malate synthase AceB [Haloferax mediterranei]AFK19770.1 malate synthase [Haloferax mediterranei ATCC 33500]AHZ23155.1 malate synthase [Haloferax mediterranei ATCC 33500]EMA00092.1 malate synthase [Haloferax mediterranei ATCC 33500]MDX5987485.1 malate synthase AceB [Haloferax mediterranei ATCC 33500]QCQ73985.1 malate synthase [Haloferax mediterranei ATCC 33500]